MTTLMICSNCFSNYGFRTIVKKYGNPLDVECPNCHSKNGAKVTNENVEEILDIFFVEGTITPQYLHQVFRVIELEDQYWEGDRFDYAIGEDVLQDLNLIKGVFKKTVFTPPINMARGWGDTLIRYEIEDRLNKTNKNKLNDKLRLVLDRLIACFNQYPIKKDELLFRVRKNPLSALSPNEYDTPPLKISKKLNGRLNSKRVPLFYCSTMPETCIYESQFEPTDTLILAAYEANKEIVVVDLEELNVKYLDGLEEEFKDIYNQYHLSLFLDAITRSKNEYFFLQLITNRLYEKKYSGIKYKSFYNRYRETEFSNIGLFGYPLSSHLLTLKSLNRVTINNVKIGFTYGPALGSVRD